LGCVAARRELFGEGRRILFGGSFYVFVGSDVLLRFGVRIEVVVDAGGAVEGVLAGSEGVRGEVPQFFFIFFDEDILVPEDVVQFLLVVVGQLLLVLHLVFVHPPELAAPCLLLVDVGDEPVDALLGVAGAVSALTLVDHVLALHHGPDAADLQLGVLELLQQVPLLRFRLGEQRLQLTVFLDEFLDLELVAARVQLVGV
jgi:hypothetical protein